jgi:hypothetical protein
MSTSYPIKPFVSIVIVNYRTAQLVIDCLHSLQDEVEQLPAAQVVIVDNVSGDGSSDRILAAIAEQGWESWVSLIEADRNGGYAYGNNVAIRSVLAAAHPPDYVLLLNPDTVIRPQAIVTLVNYLETHPKVGIAGSRLEDLDGTPQRSAFRFPSIWSELERGLRLGLVSRYLEKWVVAPPVPETICQTGWVAGASMLIRREVFDSVGLMDEDYFLYFEEVDFCLQAQRKEWDCWYVPESRVVHFVGQSSGVTTPTTQPKRLPTYWFESRQRYFVKNYGKTYGLIADSFWLLGFLLWSLRRWLQQKPNIDPPFQLQDFWTNSLWQELFSGFQKKYQKIVVNLSKSDVSSTSSSAKPSIRGLWEQIHEDWVAHGKDWTKPGFRAVAVQRFGVWRMTISPLILRAPFSVIYRFLYRFVRNFYGIELSYTIKLGRRVIIEHQHGIIVHGNCIIGDDCIIRQGVTIGNRSLDNPYEAPQLGARVNIGAGAKILGKIRLGDDVNIGANAVVLTDIASGKTAVGIPAKIINPSLAKSDLAND